MYVDEVVVVSFKVLSWHLSGRTDQDLLNIQVVLAHVVQF